MSTSTYGSSGGGPYFLHIEGLPEGYTWQDLKDLVRREATHGVWTEMVADYPSGKPTGKGYARVQRTNEAEKLYAYLTETTSLKVHLFDISVSPPCFWRSNSNTIHNSSNARLREVQSIVTQHNLQFVPVPQQLVPAYSTVPTVGCTTILAPVAFQSSSSHTVSLVQQMSNMNLRHNQSCQERNLAYYLQHQQHDFTSSTGDQRQYQSMHGAEPTVGNYGPPVYASSASGIPVNIGTNYARTERRGIFISKLNYKACEKDIVEMFSQVGKIVRCDLHRYHSTGKSKGNATIQYELAEEAQRAILRFNGQTLMSMKVEVRLDKETTTVVPPAGTAQPQTTPKPLIVNGS